MMPPIDRLQTAHPTRRLGPQAGRAARRAITVLAALAALLGPSLVGAPSAGADPGLTTQDLSGTLTPEDLANALVGTGVSVSNVQFTGSDVAAGTFAGGGTGPGSIIGFDQGIVLSSGAVANVSGPNTYDDVSTANDQPGDPDLDGLLPPGQFTEDASVLTFDFVPDASTVFFQYVFSSDEYNEYVYSYNDVFGFFVNGANCALVPDTSDPVSVDTINGGNPFGDPNASNPSQYRNNDLSDGGGSIDTEMDGLTVVLTCQASVVANETNTVKLAVADVGDDFYDSNVFIAAGSFTTEEPPGAPTGVTGAPGNALAVVSWTAPESSGGSPIDTYEVNCTATDNPQDFHVVDTDGSTTATEVSGLTNGTEYACTVRAHNGSGFGPSSDPSPPFTPSDADAAMLVDPAVGGTVDLFPDQSFLGTSGRLILPAQESLATSSGAPVVVTASLFGQPGETDETCGGNPCVGQGIDYAISDPGAFQQIGVILFESPDLVGQLNLKSAKVYKNGVQICSCRRPSDLGACIRSKRRTPDGGWKITVVADGNDPKLRA
jgi:hypothetical protein